MLESSEFSGQRIQGEIGDERNIKRKRDDTETDLQWVKKGKKRFVANNSGFDSGVSATN